MFSITPFLHVASLGSDRRRVNSTLPLGSLLLPLTRLKASSAAGEQQQVASRRPSAPPPPFPSLAFSEIEEARCVFLSLSLSLSAAKSELQLNCKFAFVQAVGLWSGVHGGAAADGAAKTLNISRTDVTFVREEEELKNIYFLPPFLPSVCERHEPRNAAIMSTATVKK